MSDDFFNDIVRNTLKNEGGYVNDPADPGGETNFGISKRSHPYLDIKNLTESKAKSIYYRNYWLPAGCNLIKDFNLANKIFDLAVNLGIHAEVILLQRALRGFCARLSEDGLLGPQTMSAVAEAEPVALLHAIKSEAAGYYRLICADKPDLRKFLEGWLIRAYK
jgi:lysozyme family protein